MAKRVFFSFHYQDVVDFRANVVRQSWVTRDREVAGFFDASLWERSRLQGDVALKRLINSGLEGTSHTTVLIGAETYARRWVRYEIFKSLERGNGLHGVHINQIRCRNGRTKPQGNNPFEFLAVRFNDLGNEVTPYEWDGRGWVPYNDVPSWRIPPQLQNARQIKPLSNWYKTYCWIGHSGYQNFSSWITP